MLKQYVFCTILAKVQFYNEYVTNLKNNYL